jgi:hypothetical protein
VKAESEIYPKIAVQFFISRARLVHWFYAKFFNLPTTRKTGSRRVRRFCRMAQGK